MDKTKVDLDKLETIFASNFNKLEDKFWDKTTNKYVGVKKRDDTGERDDTPEQRDYTEQDDDIEEPDSGRKQSFLKIYKYGTMTGSCENNNLDDDNLINCLKQMENSYYKDIENEYKEIYDSVKLTNPFDVEQWLSKNWKFAKVSRKDQLLSGVVRYTLMSVSEWITVVLSNHNYTGTTDLEKIRLKEISKIISNNGTDINPDYIGFLKYLTILVSWVNINEDKLFNPEIINMSGIDFGPGYPPKNDKFNLYKYMPSDNFNSGDFISNNRYLLNCINQGLLDGTYGYNVNDMVKKFALSIVAMPLNRNTFSNPLAQQRYNLFRGGKRDDDVNTPVIKNNISKLIKHIFSDTVQYLKRIAKTGNADNINVSTKSLKAIDEKIKEIEDLEDKIDKIFSDMIDRRRLLVLTNGNVASFDSTHDELKKLSKKHIDALNNLVDNHTKTTAHTSDVIIALFDSIQEVFKNHGIAFVKNP